MSDKVAHARFMASMRRKLARKRSAAAVPARLQEGMSDLQVERMRMERDEARARAVQVAMECASEHTDDDGVDLVVHYRERAEKAEAEVKRMRMEVDRMRAVVEAGRRLIAGEHSIPGLWRDLRDTLDALDDDEGGAR